MRVRYATPLWPEVAVLRVDPESCCEPGLPPFDCVRGLGVFDVEKGRPAGSRPSGFDQAATGVALATI